MWTLPCKGHILALNLQILRYDSPFRVHKGNQTKPNQTIMLRNKTHFPSQFCKMLQGSLRVTRTQLLSHFPSVSLSFHLHQEMHQSRETCWQFNIRRRFHLPRHHSALAGWGLMNWKRTHVSCCCHICDTLGDAFGGRGLWALNYNLHYNPPGFK